MKVASMIALGVKATDAQQALVRSDGNLREALSQFGTKAGSLSE
jgi:N-acetylmuramic acid 6-phosphate (MurNAc-6-P) etherase